MSKRTMQEIKEDLNKNAEELAEIEEEIDDLEYELNHTKYKQEDLEETREMLLEELYNSYPILSFTDETREDISGQFERNGKWKLCNGFVLIESNNKFEDLKESAGINTSIEYLIKDKKRIDSSIADFCEENKTKCSNYQAYIINGLHFQQCYVDRFIDYVGADNVESVIAYEDTQARSGWKQGVLLIQSKDIQALILGIRTME